MHVVEIDDDADDDVGDGASRWEAGGGGGARSKTVTWHCNTHLGDWVFAFHLCAHLTIFDVISVLSAQEQYHFVDYKYELNTAFTQCLVTLRCLRAPHRRGDV